MINQNKFFLFEYSAIDIFYGFLMWYIFKSNGSSRELVLRTPFPPEVQLKKNYRCNIWKIWRWKSDVPFGLALIELYLSSLHLNFLWPESYVYRPAATFSLFSHIKHRQLLNIL